MSVSAAFQERLDGLAAIALERQLALGEVLGDGYDWTFDLQAGLLAFSDGALGARTRSFSAQVLGTESEQSQSWLWAWANAQSGIPAAYTALSRKLREYGEREMVPELVRPTISLSEASGHAICSVASGLTSSSFYFRGPYDGGAVYLLVKDPGYRAPQTDPLVRIPHVLTELFHGSELPVVNHERTVIDYLTYHRAEVARREEGSGTAVRGVLPSGHVMARFDARRRLISVEALASGG